MNRPADRPIIKKPPPIRAVSPQHLRQARIYLRSIRSRQADPKDRQDMATYILRVFFAREGLDGLNRARSILQSRMTEEELATPEREISRVMGQQTHGNDGSTRHVMDNPELSGLEWISTQLNRGEVDAAAQSALELLANSKEMTPQIEVQLVDTLLHTGYLPSLLKVFPHLEDRHLRIQKARALQPTGSAQVQVFCLNLDRDLVRMKRAQRFIASPDTVLTRVPGVPGAALPQCFLDTSTVPISVSRRAQVGCHLGHIAAWERIVKTVPEGEFGMVAEDDVAFLFGPGAGLAQAMAVAKESGYDIVYLQARPVRKRFLSGSYEAGGDLYLIDLDILSQSRGMLRCPGWGGEGYLLTPAGARILIEMSMRLGIIGPLDNQIASYSMSVPPRILKGWREAVWMPFFEPLAALRGKDDLAKYTPRAGLIYPPLVLQQDYGYSVHDIETSLQNSQ